MRAIDTNVLVRLIVQDDERQFASAIRFVEQGAWVSVLALAETAWVLKSVYELSSQRLAAAIEMLLEHKNLTLQHAEEIAAAVERFRSEPSLGFTDCLMRQLALSAGHVPLGTFDRHLGRIDGAQRL